MIRDVEHVVIDYSPNHFAGHPLQGGIFNFGGGEIAVIYHRAACAYREPADVQHGYGGYQSRAQHILARSYDYGRTWDRSDDVVLFDEAAPLAERRAFVTQAHNNLTITRDSIDLSSPDAAIYFGRTWAGEGDPPALLCFAIRSGDRGRSWEHVPTLINPPTDRGPIYKDAHPLVQMLDGTQLSAMSHNNAIWLYGTDDNGLTWECLAHICSDATGMGLPAYAALLLLPSGHLQCYTLNIGGQRTAIQMCHSDDGGYSWSTPRPIVRLGRSPWTAQRQPHQWAAGLYYHSPWPLRLADGRIVVTFSRRKPPMGLGLIVSEDEGATWSDEQILRADAIHWDLGYAVATEVGPGQILTAYYYPMDDGNAFGGTKYLAGTHFTI
jgi:hypothetical protein